VFRAYRPPDCRLGFEALGQATTGGRRGEEVRSGCAVGSMELLSHVAGMVADGGGGAEAVVRCGSATGSIQGPKGYFESTQCMPSPKWHKTSAV
jgi:hypothetical protein